MNKHLQEYLRRIHQASGVPTEQAVDTTGASPRSGAFRLDSTPGSRLRGPFYHNAAIQMYTTRCA